MTNINVKDATNSTIQIKGDTRASGFIPSHNIERPFELRAARGEITGLTSWTAHAMSSTVTNGAYSDIFAAGGLRHVLASAQSLNVVSTSANDTNTSGTGARQVTITGLGASFAALTEVVNLNGTTPVATSNNFLRINRVQVTSTGSTGYNEGTVTISTINSPNYVVSQITTQEGLSSQTHFTTSSSESCYIYRARTSVLTGQASFRLVTVDYTTASQPKQIIWDHWENLFGGTVVIPLPYMEVGPNTDIYLQGTRTSGSGNIVVYGTLELLIAGSTYE